MSALVAFIHMPAKNRGAAVLDRMQDLPVVQIQQMPVFFGKLLAMYADDVSHLARWLLHHDSITGGLATTSNGLVVCWT